MVWIWPLGPHAITSLYDMSMGIYSCSKFIAKTMNSRVAFEIPHVGTWSKIGPKWGHFGSILGVPNSVGSTNTLIYASKTPVLGRKWPFVDGPPKGPISDPRVQNPDPSESYPLRAKMTLKMDDLGTPDRRADPWSHNGHQDLHPRLVFASHCCTMERTSFGSKWGPFWVPL